MKKSYLYILLAILFLAGLQFNSAQAQNKINIELIHPPSNELSAGDVWKMRIKNLTDSTLNIYLVGSVDKDGKRVVDGTSANIICPPGITNYNYRSFETGTVNWYDNALKESIFRTGNVPAGSINSCMQAFSSNNNIPLSINTCIDHEVMQTAMLEALTPENGSEISPKELPQFSWTYGGKIPKEGFTLEIKELSNKKGKSPESEWKSRKTFFKMNKIKELFFKLPSSAMGFEIGNSYGWVISIGGAVSSINVFTVSIPSHYTVDFTKLLCTNVPGKYDFEITVTVYPDHGYNSVEVKYSGISILSTTPNGAATYPILSNIPLNISTPGTGIIKGVFMGANLTQIQLKVSQTHSLNGIDFIKEDMIDGTIINNCVPPVVPSGEIIRSCEGARVRLKYIETTTEYADEYVIQKKIYWKLQFNLTDDETHTPKQFYLNCPRGVYSIESFVDGDGITSYPPNSSNLRYIPGGSGTDRLTINSGFNAISPYNRLYNDWIEMGTIVFLMTNNNPTVEPDNLSVSLEWNTNPFNQYNWVRCTNCDEFNAPFELIAGGVPDPIVVENIICRSSKMTISVDGSSIPQPVPPPEDYWGSYRYLTTPKYMRFNYTWTPGLTSEPPPRYWDNPLSSDFEIKLVKWVPPPNPQECHAQYDKCGNCISNCEFDRSSQKVLKDALLSNPDISYSVGRRISNGFIRLSRATKVPIPSPDRYIFRTNWILNPTDDDENTYLIQASYTYNNVTYTSNVLKFIYKPY